MPLDGRTRDMRRSVLRRRAIVKCNLNYNHGAPPLHRCNLDAPWLSRCWKHAARDLDPVGSRVRVVQGQPAHDARRGARRSACRCMHGQALRCVQSGVLELHDRADLQDLHRLGLLGLHTDLWYVPQPGQQYRHVQRHGDLQAESAEQLYAAVIGPRCAPLSISGEPGNGYSACTWITRSLSGCPTVRLWSITNSRWPVGSYAIPRTCSKLPSSVDT